MEDIYLNKEEKPLIISIVATQSGMGKTTLIEKLLIILKERGYAVGVLKHDAHDFEIDKKGKDSYRFFHAGADQVIISSSEKLAMIRKLKEEMAVKDIIKLFSVVDIILIEGFKANPYPKIEVHRKAVGNTLLYNNHNFDEATFLAIASDEELDINLPVLDIDNGALVTDFIEEYYNRLLLD